MRLKSFGCSFIFGSDLADDGRDKYYATHSRHTWPALLAKRLGMNYDCYAKPGSGNLRIAERVLSQAACNEQNLYVIGWSWIDRFDYTDRQNHWLSIMPTMDTDVSHSYYRDLHSQYRDKLTSLMAIKSCVDTLKLKGCPFIMTYMDDLLWETEWHTTPAITDLQNYVRPYFTDFGGDTFLEWSRKNGYPISDMLHPLESAHLAACDYVESNLSSAIKNQQSCPG
jgi:hypothetical protein